VLEAIETVEQIGGSKLDWTYVDQNRIGDHIWWIGDNSRFAEHHPGWELTHDVTAILTEMHEANRDRWAPL
jgi:CDP-paratose 2-epimerase